MQRTKHLGTAVATTARDRPPRPAAADDAVCTGAYFA